MAKRKKPREKAEAPAAAAPAKPVETAAQIAARIAADTEALKVAKKAAAKAEREKVKTGKKEADAKADAADLAALDAAMQAANAVAHIRTTFTTFNRDLVKSMADDIERDGQQVPCQWSTNGGKPGRFLLNGRRRFAAIHYLKASGKTPKELPHEYRHDLDESAPDFDAKVEVFCAKDVTTMRKMDGAGVRAFYVLKNWKASGEPGELTKYTRVVWTVSKANAMNAKAIDKFNKDLAEAVANGVMPIGRVAEVLSWLNTAGQGAPPKYDANRSAELLAQFAASGWDAAWKWYKKESAPEPTEDASEGDTETEGNAPAVDFLDDDSLLAPLRERVKRYGWGSLRDSLTDLLAEAPAEEEEEAPRKRETAAA